MKQQTKPKEQQKGDQLEQNQGVIREPGKGDRLEQNQGVIRVQEKLHGNQEKETN